MADACCFLKPQKFVQKNKILDGKIQASREFWHVVNICIISSIYLHFDRGIGTGRGTQCARTELNKRSLPKPTTTVG